MSQEEKNKKAEKEALKLKQLLIQLNTGDTDQQIKALKSLQVHGQPKMIEALVRKLDDDIEEKVEKEIIEFFCSIKDTGVVPFIMTIINENHFPNQRQKLLNTLWNSKVDYSEYLQDFVNIAVNGDFMDALEAITIIENLEGPFEEEQVLESQLHLTRYIENGKTQDEQKAYLISEITVKLQEIERGLGA